MLFETGVAIDNYTKSPKFNLGQTYSKLVFHKLFIEIFKYSFIIAQKCLKKYMPIIEVFV